MGTKGTSPNYDKVPSEEHFRELSDQHSMEICQNWSIFQPCRVPSVLLLFSAKQRALRMEKYSCKASKLHLKPRRFKIFVEARTNFSKTERRMRGKDHPRRNIFLLPRLLFQINTSHLEVTQEQSKLLLLIVIIFKKNRARKSIFGTTQFTHRC